MDINNLLNEMPSFSQGSTIQNNVTMDEKGTLERGNKVLDLLTSTGTNWSVLDKPLFAKADDEILTTDSRGLFRSDNKENLGVVGSRYEVMQNSVLAETLVDLQSQFGGHLRGGNLSDGKKIYYQLSLEDAKVGNYQNNAIKRYITCLNSHDGSSSIGFGSTNEVVICSNTFYTAMKDISKFRHTASASDRLSQAIVGFEKALNGEAKIIENYNRMASAEVTETIVQRIINGMFNPKPNKDGVIPTRTKNNVQMFAKAYNIEKEQKGGESLWTLFNAVTRYTNHMEKQEKDLNYLMTGGGYKKNLMAYNTIVKWLSEPTKTSVMV
jgi:phage/plasmid-like protein (TIGR03299 family)